VNVLVVDDEPIIRLGLRTLIDWESCGLVLCGEAADGVEAWEVISEGGVDIVVTDILMPRMDGLELVRKLKTSGADTAVVVLSCLDDFDYVKEAMKHGASDYILKPTMEPEGLVSILLETKSALEASRADKQRFVRWELELQQSKHMHLGKRLERSFATGQIDPLLEDELFPEGQPLLAVCVRTGLSEQLYHIEWNIHGLHAVMRVNERTALLLFAEESSISQQEMYRLAYSKAMQVDRMLQHTISGVNGLFIGIGGTVRSVHDTRQAVHTFDRQLQYRFYREEEGTIGTSEEQIRPFARLPQDERIDLLRAISAGNTEAMLDAAGRIGHLIAEETPAVSKAHLFLYELLGMAAGYARDQQYNRIDELETAYVQMDTISSIATIGDYNRYMRDALLALASGKESASGGLQSRNPFIRQAVQFMRNNFSRNITTTDIAEHVRLSRSYLSDLYSKEIGEPLTESLTRIRIDEAKRLLKGGQRKVYEVAESVGIPDTKTFAKTFKRVVGCTPKEYVDI
jgi:two-component system response regulator YesN